MEQTKGLGGWGSALKGRFRPPHSIPCVFSIAVASGKGGTGKSVITASLAAYFASLHHRVTIFDADLGVGNAHILQGISPAYTMAHVITGRVDLDDIGLVAPTGVKVLPAGSGVGELASLNVKQLQAVAKGFVEVEKKSDYLFIDSAAGISEQTMSFLYASDIVLLVTTPDLTAMTDAYALIKVLHRRDKFSKVLLVVNRVMSEEEGLSVAEKIQGVTKRFLAKTVDLLGIVPEDQTVKVSVGRKIPFLLDSPDAPAAAALHAIGEKLGDSFLSKARAGTFSGRMLSRIS